MERTRGIFLPILWTIITVLYLLSLCWNIKVHSGDTVGLVLNSLCVAATFVQAVVQWRNYKKGRNASNSDEDNSSDDTKRI